MANFAFRLRMPLVAVMVMMIVAMMAEATPPGIAKNPSSATCKIKKYKHCYNLVHVCPKFCPDQCYVECASCKPICGSGGDANSPPDDDSTPPSPSSQTYYSPPPPVLVTPTPPSTSMPNPSYSPPPSPPTSFPTPSYSPPLSPSTLTPTPSYSPPLTPSTSTPIPSYSPPLPPHTSTPTPSYSPPVPPHTSTPTPSYSPPVPPHTSTPTPSYSPPVPPHTSTPTPSYSPPVPPHTSTPTPSYSPPVPPHTSTPTPSYSPPLPPPTWTPTPSYSPPLPPPTWTPTPSYSPPFSPPISTPTLSYSPPLPPKSPTPPTNSNPPTPSTPSPPLPSGPPPTPLKPPSAPITYTPPSASPTPISQPSSPPRPPPTGVVEQPPTPTSPSSWAEPAKRVRCKNVNYPQCYNMIHTCPSACPAGCEVDCATCKPVCHCDRPGAVCQDPRFIGGDGITFYFHGKKDRDFCLVSDSNLHINAHFIGKRNPSLKRDFTWVQSLGILFKTHRLFIAAQKTAIWDDSVDRLTVSLDGRPVTLKKSAGSQWQHPAENPTVAIVRLDTANHMMVEVKGLFRITAKVVPITDEDSRIHNYGMTNEDSFAHLDIGFKFFGLSGEVNGILGQTYGNGYVSDVNVKAAMSVMGKEEKFETSSLFAPDCAVAIFGTNKDRQVA